MAKKFTFGVTVGDLVRPVAAIALGVVRQALGTIENERSALDAVHEFAALLPVADLEVSVLMGAIFRGLCGLCK